MKSLAYFLAIFGASSNVYGFGIHDKPVVDYGGDLKHVNFVKPVDSVLHDQVKIISVNEDKLTGAVAYETWRPSSDEILAAEDVLIDPENLAVVRQKQEGGKSSLVGVVNGRKVEHHSDFIDTPVNLTYSAKARTLSTPPLVVETLVVVDKEFADVFQQNRVRILDYLTVYFWDVNMRYKTLPSVDLSFRVTGVVIISTPAGQPFIEEARATDGRADFGRILYRFSDWVNQNVANFPKFDLAIAITNTRVEWGGGLAYGRANCNNRGATVFNDGGDWGSVTTSSHEIAHTLGAPHDEDSPGCQAKGYIMSGGTDYRWFFSDCSDRHISEYVTSDQASCLRRIDEPGLNPISPDFSAIKPPTMEARCKQLYGPTAYMEERDTANCETSRCLVPANDGWISIYYAGVVENSLCLGGGRCFRGKCRVPDYLVQNVGTGQCIKAPNQFAFTVDLEMVNCPQPGTPLDRFAVSDTSLGKTLGTPWQTLDGKEHGDRCVYVVPQEGANPQTDRCSGTNPWHGWDFVDVGNGEFLLSHRLTKRCAKQVGNRVQVYVNCNVNDRNMRWKLQ